MLIPGAALEQQNGAMARTARCTAIVFLACLALPLPAEVGAVPQLPASSTPGERSPNEMKNYFGALLSAIQTTDVFVSEYLAVQVPQYPVAQPSSYVRSVMFRVALS